MPWECKNTPSVSLLSLLTSDSSTAYDVDQPFSELLNNAMVLPILTAAMLGSDVDICSN